MRGSDKLLKTFKEMCDDESICDYCSATDYGENKSFSTLNGYYMCEGTWCKEAYESYLDNEDTTENIVKYASKIKLTNKEEFE
jgi:hypothetical protein